MCQVSILVPIFNVEKYIERCAISLFEQTYKEIEYIFVDDCSPDDSVKILEKIIERYPQRREHIRIIHHKKNRGLAAARNTAVDNCKTDFLMHVDSDDWLELDAIEKLVHEQKKTGCDIVTGNMAIWKNENTEVLRRNEPKDKETLICEYIKPSNAAHVLCGRLIRKSLYSDNNIAALEGYDIGEDYQVIPQLFYCAKNFSFVDDCIYNYDRTNVGSYTGRMNNPDKFVKKVVQDLQAFDVVNYFFLSRSEHYFYEKSCAELAKYVLRVTPVLANFGQKSAFQMVWKRFEEIDNSFIKNIFDKRTRILLTIKKKYMLCRWLNFLR